LEAFIPYNVRFAPPTASEAELPLPSSKDQWCSRVPTDGTHDEATERTEDGTMDLLRFDVDHDIRSP
jgi:hypothetical protein